MTDKELLELIDVEEFLTELGIRNVRDTHSGEIQYSCPFPGHSGMDTSPSTTMTTVERPVKDRPGEFYPPTTFYCFTCGMRGTAITFLAEYEGISPIKAKRFIRERFAPGYTPDDVNVLDMINKILEPKATAPMIRPVSILDEEEIEKRWVNWPEVYMEWEETKNSPVPFNYMLDRGFTPEILDEYNIGFDPISKRFSIPARDEEGKLLGFKGRSWWDGAKPKYLALGGEQYGFEPYEVSRVLWGLHIARKVYPEKCIVIEGELNALKMHQYGHTNTVGISGRRLSRIQIDLIRKYFDSAIMYFDDIQDGQEAASKLVMDMPILVVQEHDKDACDSTSSEVFDLLSTVRHAIL